MFTIAGTVIVYGTATNVAYGFIYWLAVRKNYRVSRIGHPTVNWSVIKDSSENDGICGTALERRQNFLPVSFIKPFAFRCCL